MGRNTSNPKSRRVVKLTSEAVCPVERVIGLIGGRWKCTIIHHLLDGAKRHSELRRLIPEVSQKMLTAHLRELERDGIVEKETFDEALPHTEYSLSKLGRSFEALLWNIHEWAQGNLPDESK